MLWYHTGGDVHEFCPKALPVASSMSVLIRVLSTALARPPGT